MKGARRGPEGKSLEAGSEDRAHCAPVMKHNSGPQTREVVDGGGCVIDRGCWVEEPHSSRHRAIGKYMAGRSQRALSSLDGKAQSHRGGPLTPGW